MLDLKQIESFYPEEIRPFRRHILREYLQHKILESNFRSSWGSKLAFMGGTCIHLIHGSPRFSEHLDFDNIGLSSDQFSELTEAVRRDLHLEGYSVELKTTFGVAFHAYFRFPTILHESGITGHREQKLLIEVDAEPQHFEYEPDAPLISKFDIFCRIRTVPVSIFLAQKFSCIFSRRRPMGRDFYDASYMRDRLRSPEYILTC